MGLTSSTTNYSKRNDFTVPTWLSDKLLEDRGLKKLEEETPKLFKDIDFDDALVVDNGLYKYEILLYPFIPNDVNIILIFPNHRIYEKTILKVNEYKKNISKLEKEINQRIKDSLNDTDLYGKLKFVVCCGETVYRIWNVSNCYIFWAQYIKKLNQNNVKAFIYENVPILIKTNGYLKIQQVYFFKNENTILYKNATCNFPVQNLKSKYFCCEADPRKTTTSTLTTYSTKVALDKTTTMIMENAPSSSDLDEEEELPFSSNDPPEVIYLDENQVYDNSKNEESE